jgi:hypothetical protein
MVAWVAFVIIGVALLQMVVSLVFALRSTPPNDYTLGLTALLGVALVVQALLTVVMQVRGSQPTGDIVEFWAYLGTAIVLAPGAIVWGLIERTKWATWALVVVGFSLAVMMYRMYAIWFIQVL